MGAINAEEVWNKRKEEAISKLEALQFDGENAFVLVAMEPRAKGLKVNIYCAAPMHMILTASDALKEIGLTGKLT